MWEHLCVACLSLIFLVQELFWVGMDACHVFSECMLTLISLIGSEFGVVVNTSIPGCWANPHLCPVDVTSLSGAGCALSCCRSPQIGF